MNEASHTNEIWFVYDGECPLCKSAALALKIKQDYGRLHLLNARESSNHELIQEINQRQLDLDDGMVIYDDGRFYHGKDVLIFMARYGDSKGMFNLFTKIFFWSDMLARISYPWIRGTRNFLLRFKDIGRIDNLQLKNEPTFKRIFGETWDQLPPVIRKRYANRPYTDDRVTVEGKLDVMCAGPLNWLAPFFWLMGTVPPHNEKNVPVTVHFDSNKNTQAFAFNRIFHFRQRQPYAFYSRMLPIKNNELVEVMRFGIGWHMKYAWEDGCVKLKHKGYMLHWFGHFISLPLTFLLGEGNAEEKAIDDNSFAMWVQITHPWWGRLYEYKGQFTVVKEA